MLVHRQNSKKKKKEEEKKKMVLSKYLKRDWKREHGCLLTSSGTYQELHSLDLSKSYHFEENKKMHSCILWILVILYDMFAFTYFFIFPFWAMTYNFTESSFCSGVK
jgi:hypothetical protein